MIKRPVAIGLSPNVELNDSMAAVNILIKPFEWKQGEKIGLLERWFLDYFAVSTAVSFNAGRSALLALLHAFEIGKGDEVLVQAFTCVAVPNSVSWSGASPIFVDIDNTLNIDTSSASKKITPRTKALIVQHTFGVPADMEKVTAFCKKHKLVLIEDCAHALGATYKGKLVGTFGDAAFFSFGRDKIVSSVFGGMAIVSKTHEEAAKRLSLYQDALPFPSQFWILQQLIHVIVSPGIFFTYHFLNSGKALLWFLQKLKLISIPVYPQEKQGINPKLFPRKLPHALASLALLQLDKLMRFNKHRVEIADFYRKTLDDSNVKLTDKIFGAVYLRFSFMTPAADQIRFAAKKEKMILGNWYRNIIDPVHTNFKAVGYIVGSCPKAEKAASTIVNLPTYPTLSKSQAEKIMTIVKKYVE